MKKYKILLLLIPLAGCGLQDSSDAHKAQSELIGAEITSIYACAGLPNESKNLDDGSYIFEYYKNIKKSEKDNSYTYSGKSCMTIIRTMKNRVVQIHYSGDNDELFGTEGVCASILRPCLRR